MTDIWEAAFNWRRDLGPKWPEPGAPARAEKPPLGNVRRTPRPKGLLEARCLFCGAPTKLIGRRLFCRACGYFESCCDGGKESVPGEC